MYYYFIMLYYGYSWCQCTVIIVQCKYDIINTRHGGTRHQFDLETLELLVEFDFSLVSYFYVISLSYFN